MLSCFSIPLILQPITPLPHLTERQSQPFCLKLCATDHPQVRRLSLPTTRERRYLHDIRVRRAEGRPLRQTRTVAFSLKVWPLIVAAPRGHLQYPKEVDVRHPHTQLQGDPNDEVNDAFSKEDTDEFADASIIPDVEDVSSEPSIALSSCLAVKISPNFDSQQVRNTDEYYLTQIPKSISAFPKKDDDHAHQMQSLTAADNQMSSQTSWHASPLLCLPPAKHQQPLALDHLNLSVPPWAYIVVVHAPKTTIGKRAVIRNRVKRRVRAAAAQIFPPHASRQFQYVLSAHPESLVLRFENLVDDMRIALKSIDCFEDNLTIEEIRREKYCER